MPPTVIVLSVSPMTVEHNDDREDRQRNRCQHDQSRLPRAEKQQDHQPAAIIETLSRGAIVMAIAEQTSVRIAAVRIVIGVAVAAPVAIETVIAGPIPKAETPVVIEMSAVIEVTVPGKVLICKAMAGASKAAAHMAAAETNNRQITGRPERPSGVPSWRGPCRSRDWHPVCASCP